VAAMPDTPPTVGGSGCLSRTRFPFHKVTVKKTCPFLLMNDDRPQPSPQVCIELAEFGRVYFVTRLKENAAYAVVEDFAVPHRRGVRRDQVIFFYQLAQAGIDAYFRRIEFYDEEHDRVLVFLTSHMGLAAATIAAVYKERWQIELFFRALKQSLRVKTFVGTSAQALKTQLWTALI